MKAITIRQPWAAWIFIPSREGMIKTYEIRSWDTEHRGMLAIHTAQRVADMPDDRMINAQAHDDLRAWERGAIIGVVDLTRIDRRFAEQTFCWRLDSPILLPEPIKARGQTGRLWDVPDWLINI